MGISSGGSLGLTNAVQGFLMSQANVKAQKQQDLTNQLASQMLMGQATPEQQQRLAQTNPQVFMGLQQQQQAKQAQIDAQQRELIINQLEARAMNGDNEALNQLAQIDLGKANSVVDFMRKLQTPNRTDKPAGVSEFEYLTEGLTDAEKLLAKKINLGLESRNISNAEITAIKNGTIDSYADYKTEQKQREKFAEATGANRAKLIDDGFVSINKFNSSISNIDSAIKEIKAGAGTGFIEKMLPSIRASSVALDNIRNSMALDVIGATTFGALSEGELKLAQDVALPTGLDNKELAAYLQNKKAAQEKLRDYYMDQIQFLDQGGTIAGFLRAKEREKNQAPMQQDTQQQQGVIPPQGQVINLSNYNEAQQQAINAAKAMGMTDEQIKQELEKRGY